MKKRSIYKNQSQGLLHLIFLPAPPMSLPSPHHVSVHRIGRSSAGPHGRNNRRASGDDITACPYAGHGGLSGLGLG